MRRKIERGVHAAPLAGCVTIAPRDAHTAIAETATAPPDRNAWTVTSKSQSNGEVVMFPYSSGRMDLRGLMLGITWTTQGIRMYVTARFRGKQRAEQDRETVFKLS